MSWVVLAELNSRGIHSDQTQPRTVHGPEQRAVIAADIENQIARLSKGADSCACEDG